MERQILMQNQMRERQMAMQIACAIKRKKASLLFPILPLGFIFAYQVDSAYGTLNYRMRGEAESIMESEHDRLDLPLGTPTFESIEKARRAKSSLSSFLEK
ncbi:Plasminogen receptor (KT) [Nibea albiflora]|uniref:Plasminogen receptor (KT) n=1 Tax=Nibea albiflora TaxID=240163 RepID=A0ACB7F9R1_NIBAL|nr:Plasminogen receptor (KT) [Nibea albiflora]